MKFAYSFCSFFFEFQSTMAKLLSAILKKALFEILLNKYIAIIDESLVLLVVTSHLASKTNRCC